jgi:hypothetical protein
MLLRTFDDNPLIIIWYSMEVLVIIFNNGSMLNPSVIIATFSVAHLLFTRGT